MKRLAIVVIAASAVLFAGCGPSGAPDAGQPSKEGYVVLSPKNGGEAYASFCPTWPGKSGRK